MLGLNTPGLPVWLSRSDNPKRKLAHTLELIEVDGALVGVNTMHPNKIAAEAVAEGLIPELAGYPILRREVKYGENSRVDLVLEAPSQPLCFVEVKNCHLLRGGGLARFPVQRVTAPRPQAPLRTLRPARRMAGARAVMLFVIQRTDCIAFDAAHDIDAAYGAGLIAAAQAGVEVLCYELPGRPTAASA